MTAQKRLDWLLAYLQEYSDIKDSGEPNAESRLLAEYERKFPMAILPAPLCIGCGKCPDELEEYVEAAREEDLSPDQYVRLEEGTYNPENGHFACTDCWIAMGCPTAPGRGWRAP